MNKKNIPINILLIEHAQSKQNNLQMVLLNTGYNIIDTLCSSSIDKSSNDSDSNHLSLFDHVEKHRPDVIVIDVEFPKETMLKSLQRVSQHQPTPIVMFSEQEGTNLIQLLVKCGVTAYVAGETDFRRVKSILDTALARFSAHESLKQELELTKNKLSNQRMVEKAKLLLMQNKKYSEQEAYHSMRKMAMDNGQKVEEVAKSIVSLSSIL